MASRVLVVDDHPVVRNGIVSMVGAHPRLEVVGGAGDLATARARMAEGDVDLLLCDVSLPDGSGLTLVRELRERWPDLGILVLSVHEELLYAERALRAGANGYLPKTEDPDVIIQGALAIVDGGRAVSEAVLQRLEGHTDDAGVPASPVSRLSDRELEIFELTGRGHGTRRVSGLLGISIKTVETHKANIRGKLGLANAGELLRAAVAWLAEIEQAGA